MGLGALALTGGGLQDKVTDSMRADGPTGEAAGERTTATHLLWGRRTRLDGWWSSWRPGFLLWSEQLPTHRQSCPRVISTDLGCVLPLPMPHRVTSPLGRHPSPWSRGLL